MVTYLGIGTNLGDRAENLTRAVALISEQVGMVLACSSFIETAPWGFASENRFLNAVLKVDTLLGPEALLQATQAVERQMGRTHKTVDGNYTDRVIDVDILLYEDVVMKTPELTIPHPYILQRDFVYIPLEEIAPEVLLALRG
ncbi:MAG: 2-amino-4-hydroxy-6-hydroxymethyldihydropteridine diphosphokinase [Bacteroidaceae bacterium]|nr:2-amino-4-hydroxy-6-hydroxymethyldihydropteridine diphosphokinase [Bacteroidaceae bacterium]